ncbi:cysteine proteinase [Aureobasidium pullulans]|uniref:ubiquitinyl hydrolase 1 n=1 Tax=Aureobasidium pullulans TaxID=5580 RepID=A0AB38MCQ2_AURPU|nr:cysteine proteinase [Aureobasidium pullulans]THZ46564.1 cysteine proteinase [Aureobasidium pullulans]THZ80403.1 cysteine proteinase [Aureobasidium pullulans]
MYTYVGVPNYYQGDRMYPYGDYSSYTTSYRPAEMQMPMRPSALGMPELHHQHHHHHQPLVDHSQFIHSHQHQQPQQPRHTPAAMAYSQSEDEMAQLQKLSAEFQPEVTGPFVSEKQLTSALIEEYAAADPVYRTKTSALPHKYSHYRTTRGDGRCGWRAVAFGYFENLFRFGDRTKFLEEETRLKSLGNVINMAGYSQFIWEDFADEIHGLLRKCMSADASKSEAFLLEHFNNEETQNGIITYLKTLTSAWMKTRPNDYAPFVLPHTVPSYCDANIDPHQIEIDHPGMQALTDVLLKPAGVSLEVIYLDRSAGTEVNAHQFAPGLSSSQIIRLLYRPGHYDILYQPDQIFTQPPPSQPIAVPTYLQSSLHHYEEPVMDLGMSDFMTMIPGMSLLSSQSNWMPNQFYGVSDYSAPTSAMPPPPVQAPAPMSVQHHAPSAPVSAVTPAYAPAAQTPSPTSTTDYAFSPVSQTTFFNYDQLSYGGKGNFRPSTHMFEQNGQNVAAATAQNSVCQTAQFKHSHFNRTHFLNPEFHPEEWDPSKEYIVPNTRSKSKSSR